MQFHAPARLPAISTESQLVQRGDPQRGHGFQGASPRPVCPGRDARGQVAVGQL